MQCQQNDSQTTSSKIKQTDAYFYTNIRKTQLTSNASSVLLFILIFRSTFNASPFSSSVLNALILLCILNSKPMPNNNTSRNSNEAASNPNSQNLSSIYSHKIV